ncbi:DUF1707 SHOCT-like domain-containing protein [Corynebacterium terpenotabidum]|uniref:DUF1707 domain-containing protein n=1 Tax=Corynebacterium terpenotabidum Y-11 TaxID=1200352 RepID=S4XFR1_9CORY|nr:DUF1707 domain-containing protein [Corynebacterium terpenotabidum]AGP31424.1 hypothetical protein A606_08915 [Corynebacterium terpenotabidum Y-11]
MNDPHDPRDNHVRIGDADRERAMSLLGAHFADGRLEVTEYDERCRAVAEARTRADLDALFTDLPVLPNQQVPGTTMAVYSAAEIAEQHRRGANPRAGIVALTSIAAVGAAVLLNSGASIIPILVIPMVAVLLYVMKIGPTSWYTPSPEALERARVKKIRQAQQLQLEEKKAARKLKQTEITTDALNMAHRAIGRAGQTVSDTWQRQRRDKR